MDTSSISKVINESCKYKLGDELLYNAAYPAYHVKIISRMIVENSMGDSGTEYVTQYDCVRLGRVDFVIATDDELEEIE